MSYFEIQIDNDITYLLTEIGHNVLVNNVPARAIINNSSMERTYDDKKIVTHEELKRGHYISYNDLKFLLLNEVNDKRYLTYYKGVMRRCNYDIKFMIEDKLYLFYSIVEGEKFSINDTGMITTSTDKILVTLPNTATTKKLKKQFSFLLFGQKWDIEGIDFTRDGLITLHCEVTQISGTTDDLQNAIAERYNSDGTDKLKGNTKPILPFDPVPVTTNNIISVPAFNDINVDYNTLIEDITLPMNVVVTLDDSTSRELPITWNTSTYDGTIADTYNLVGSIGLSEGITNTNNLVASINIIVAEEPDPSGGITYALTGSDTLKVYDAQLYTAMKFIDGVQDTTAKFTFTVSDETMAEIWEVTDTTLDLEGKNKNVGQFFTITATDRITLTTVSKEVQLINMY